MVRIHSFIWVTYHVTEIKIPFNNPGIRMGILCSPRLINGARSNGFLSLYNIEDDRNTV